MITTNLNKDSESFIIEENKYYWIYISETFSLIKIKQINIPKDIIFIESEIILIENKISLCDKDEEKKLNYPDRISLILFDITQLDPENNDLALIPNITYASILQNIKFKFLQKISIIKAGKITLGINLTSNTFSNYNNFSNKIFPFKFEKNTNHTIIINGVSNCGKSILNKNLLYNIFINNKKNFNDFYFNNSQNKTQTNKLKDDEKDKDLNLIFILEKINLFLEFINFFGNSIENSYRYESSRYMRVTKFFFGNTGEDKINNSEDFITKIKFKHYLLEKSRILQENSFKFHIFHAFIHGLSKLFTNDEYYKRLISTFPDYTKTLIENYQEYKHFIIQYSLIYEDLYFNDQTSIFYEEKFFIFLKIFQEISFHRKLLIKIFNIIFIVVILRNIQYTENEDGHAELDQENPDFKNILNLMNFETNEEKILFTKRLISREIGSPSGSFYLIKFTLEEANRTKENFIKFLYENLFDYVTNVSNLLINIEIEKFNENKIFLKENLLNTTNDFENSIIITDTNQNIETEKNPKSKKIQKNYFIQTIECFGFENSSDPKNNSLENLFINYANDKLNNLFFDNLIKGELNLYQNEGVNNPDLEKNFGEKFSNKENNTLPPLQRRDSVINNSNDKTFNRRNSVFQKKTIKNLNFFDFDVSKTLNICDNDSRGIFKLLDEQTFLINNNRGMINSFIDKITNNWPDIDSTSSSFFLVHFGCIVEYGASDFIFKNVENLSNELKFICKNLYKNLFSLTIKNFKLSKEKTMKILNKKLNEENLEDFKNQNNKNNIPSGTSRLSVTRRISRNTIKSKTNSEKFVHNLKKLLSKINSTNLNVIKLINTSSEKFYEDEYYNKDNGLDYILEPLNKNIFQIFKNKNFENFFKNVFPNNENYSSENNLENLENLILCHSFDFDDKYVLKQIYSSGILESIHLAKSGFFIRCDYKTLGEKLKIFKSFFDIKNNNNFNDWIPDKELIRKIAYLLDLEESDFILGKTLLFINNKAMLKKPSLLSCVEFPKLIIKNIFRKIIKKVKNLKTSERIFKSILIKRKLMNIINITEKGILSLNKRIFTNKLKENFRKINFAASKIQKIFCRFKNKKIKIIKLQKYFRCFFEKVKENKKRNSVMKIENFTNKKLSFYFLEAINNIKKISEKKNHKGKIINKRIKEYLRSKKTKDFAEKILSILKKNIEKKRKFEVIRNIREYSNNLNNLIKIQNLFRKKVSIKKFLVLKNNKNIQNSIILLKEIKKLSLIKYSFSLLRDFANKKNLSSLLIQNNLRKLITKKKTEIFKKQNFAFEKLINFKNTKKSELLKKTFVLFKNKAKENHQNLLAKKIQNSFRVHKAIKNLYKLKQEKETNIKFNKLKILCDNVGKLAILLNKKNFIQNIFEKNEKIIIDEKKNLFSDKIKSLLRKKISNKRLDNLKTENKKFIQNLKNLIETTDLRMNNIKIRIFFENLIKTSEYVLKLKSSTLKIQSLFRKLIAKKTCEKLKEIQILKLEKIKKDLNFFSHKINKISDLQNKKKLFSKFSDLVGLTILKDQNATKIQTIYRKYQSKKIFENLKTNRNKIIKQINLLTKIFTETKIKNNKKRFFQNFFKLAKEKHQNCIKIQNLFRKNNSILKYQNLKELHLQNKIISRNLGISKLDNFFNKFFLKYFKNVIENLKYKASFIKNTEELFLILENYQNKKNFKTKIFFINQLKNKSQLIKIISKNKIKKIQKNFRIFSHSKIEKLYKLNLLINNTRNLFEKTSKIYNDKILENKTTILNAFNDYKNKIYKIIIIQNYFKNYSIKKKVSKLLRKDELTKFINSIIKIFENKKIIVTKNIFFYNLVNNYKKFLTNYNNFLQKNSIKKIIYAISSHIIYKNNKIKVYNRKNLVLIFLRIKNKKSRILKNYLNKYRQIVRIKNIIENFIYLIQKNFFYNRYLKKLYFNKLTELYINKKISKKILKKNFFKKYTKIVLSKTKNEFINTFLELAKLNISLKKSKECKIETTEDTFSVIYSNINLIQNYEPTKNTDIIEKPSSSVLPYSKKNQNITKFPEARISHNINQLKKNHLSSNSKSKIIPPNQINLNNSKPSTINQGINNEKKNNIPHPLESKLKIDKKIKPPIQNITPIKNSLNKNNFNLNRTNLNSNTSKNTIQLDNSLCFDTNTKNNDNNSHLTYTLESFMKTNSNEENILIETNLNTEINILSNLKEINNTNNNLNSNSLNLTRKSITNYKQINNRNNKNYLDSNKKIQNDLDLLTSELEDILKDSELKVNKIASKIPEEKEIDYWKLNQEYKKKKLKQIENPLDLEFSNSDKILKNNNIHNHDNCNAKHEGNSIDCKYDKYVYKRVCYSDISKSKK